MSDQEQKKSLKTPIQHFIGSSGAPSSTGRSPFMGPAPLPPNRQSTLRRSNSKQDMEKKKMKPKRPSSVCDDAASQNLNATNEFFNSFEKSRENAQPTDQIENQSHDKTAFEEMKTQFDEILPTGQSPRQQRNGDNVRNAVRSDVFSFQNRVLTESDRHFSMPNGDSTDVNQIERFMREVNLVTSQTDGNNEQERHITEFSGGHQNESTNVQNFHSQLAAAPQLGIIQEESHEQFQTYQGHNRRPSLQQNSQHATGSGIQMLGNQVMGFDKLIPQQSPEQQTTNQSKNSRDVPSAQDGIGRHLVEGNTPPGQPNSQEYMIIFQTLLNRALKVQHLSMQVCKNQLKEELSPDQTRSFRDLCSKLLCQYEQVLLELQQARQNDQHELLQSMIDQVRANQQHLSQDNNQKEQLIGSLKSELLFAKGQLQFQKSQILKRDQEKNELLALMQQSANEKHQLSQTLQEMQMQLDQQMGSNTGALEDLKKQLESKETECASLQQMYNGSRKDNADLQNQITTIQQKLDKLDEEYKESMSQIDQEHKLAVEKAQEEATKLKVQLDKARGTEASIKERSDVLQGDLRRQVEELGKRLETTQQQKHDIAQELRQAQNKLSDVLQQFGAAKEELGQMHVRQIEHRNQYESQRGNENKLAQQVIQLRDENDYLKNALESSERRLQQGLDRVELQVALYNKQADAPQLSHCGLNSVEQGIAQAKLLEKILQKSKEQRQEARVTADDYASLKDDLDQMQRRVASIEQEKASLEQLIVEIMQFGEECELKEQALQDKIRDFEQLAEDKIHQQDVVHSQLQILLNSHHLLQQLDGYRRKKRIEETIKEVFESASQKIGQQADQIDHLSSELSEKDKMIEDQKCQRDLLQQQLDDTNLSCSDLRNLVSTLDSLTKKILLNIEEHENFLQKSASKRDRSPRNISSSKIAQQFRTFDQVCQTLQKDLTFINEWTHDQVLFACNFLKDREKVVHLNLKVNDLQKVNSLLQIENDKQRMLAQRYSQIATSQTSPDIAIAKRVSKTARNSVSQPDLNSLLSKVQTLKSEAAELPSAEVRDGSRKVRNVREVLRGLDAGGQDTAYKQRHLLYRDYSDADMHGRQQTTLDQKGSFDLKHYDQRAQRKKARRRSADSQQASSSRHHDSSLSCQRRVPRAVTPNEIDEKRTSFGNTMLEEQLNSYRQIEEPKFQILDSRKLNKRRASQDFQQTSAFLQPPGPQMESFAEPTRGLQTLDVHDNRFQTLQMYPHQNHEQQSADLMTNNVASGAYASTLDVMQDSQTQFPIIIEEHRCEQTGSHDMDRYLQNPPADERSKTETDVQEETDRHETEDDGDHQNMPLQMNHPQQQEQWEMHEHQESFDQQPGQQDDIFNSYHPTQNQTLDSINQQIHMMSYNQGQMVAKSQNRQSDYVSLNPQSVGDTFQESSMGTIQNAAQGWQGVAGVQAPANTSVQNTPSGAMGKHLSHGGSMIHSRSTSEMVSHAKPHQSQATSKQKMHHIAQLLKDQQRLMEQMAIAKQSRPNTAFGTLENTRSMTADDREAQTHRIQINQNAIQRPPQAIYQRSEPVTHRPNFVEQNCAPPMNQNQIVMAHQLHQRQHIPRPKSQQLIQKGLKTRFLHPTSQSRDAFSSSDRDSGGFVHAPHEQQQLVDERMYLTRDQQHLQRRSSASGVEYNEQPKFMTNQTRHQERAARQYESNYYSQKYA